MNKLDDVFYGTLMGAIVNPKKLRDTAWQQGIDVSYTEAQNYLRNQETNQRFKRQNPKPFHIPIIGKPDQYAMDLMFFDRGSQNIPILILQELTSRMTYAEILRNKSATETLRGFKKIEEQIKRNGFKIKSLEHDSGSEFHGEFKAYLTATGIEDIEFPRGNASKTALGKINSFIHTFRSMMERSETNFGGDWQKLVPELIDVYNHTTSSATGFAPSDVKTDLHFNFIRANELGTNSGARKKVNALEDGIKVRVLIETNIFRKGTRPKFSQEIYTITSRQGYSFYLKDSEGKVVQAQNLNGDPINKPRPFRAWELLVIDEDEVKEPPTQFRTDTERLDERERRRANVVNRERNRIDAEPIVQETPNPTALEETRPRELRERTQREPLEKRTTRGPRVAREPTEPEETLEGIVVKVLAHRRTRCPEFQILWKMFENNPDAPENLTWQPLENFRNYDRSTRSWVYNPIVLAYMKDHKLNPNQKKC
jgi:hypothetical protein